VNGAYKDDSPNITPLGKLIHDFNCINADDMYYPVLAERTRYLKEDAKGAVAMCRIVEELTREFAEEVAVKIIDSGKMTLEEISECTGLSVDELKALENAN
jgi:hypothetical protein